MRSWARCVVVLIVAATVGCSGNVKVYPVQGRVTFEGKPLRGGGTIAFVPAENQPGKTAGGEIAADGNYELTTYSPGDGCMAGTFRVVITQIVEKEPPRTADGERVAKVTAVVPPAERIPAAYGDHHGSPLTATVEQKKNSLDFDLKRDAQ